MIQEKLDIRFVILFCMGELLVVFFVLKKYLKVIIQKCSRSDQSFNETGVWKFVNYDNYQLDFCIMFVVLIYLFIKDYGKIMKVGTYTHSLSLLFITVALFAVQDLVGEIPFNNIYITSPAVFRLLRVIFVPYITTSELT